MAAIDDASQKTLDQLIKVQKTLQDSINQTAERNNFTVKGIGTSGQGMLSDVMNRISDYLFVLSRYIGCKNGEPEEAWKKD